MIREVFRGLLVVYVGRCTWQPKLTEFGGPRVFRLQCLTLFGVFPVGLLEFGVQGWGAERFRARGFSGSGFGVSG